MRPVHRLTTLLPEVTLPRRWTPRGSTASPAAPVTAPPSPRPGVSRPTHLTALAERVETTVEEWVQLHRWRRADHARFPTGSLAFEAGQRDAPQDVPLSEAEDADQRKRGERCRRHQEAPLGRVLGPKGE
jgi:hypothetical protein